MSVSWDNLKKKNLGFTDFKKSKDQIIYHLTWYKNTDAHALTTLTHMYNYILILPLMIFHSK